MERFSVSDIDSNGNDVGEDDEDYYVGSDTEVDPCHVEEADLNPEEQRYARRRSRKSYTLLFKFRESRERSDSE